MLATISFSATRQADASTVLNANEQQQVAHAVKHDAEVMTDTQLQEQLAGRPRDVQDEVLDINTVARHRGLQVALLIPLLAALLGLGNSFRMMRLPDPAPSEAAEAAAFG
jgi:hypothetical protein